MRLGSLFSGGKDSAFAAWKAMQDHDVVCLVSIVSGNRFSYMFHTPNIHLTGLQAEAAGLPLVRGSTRGVKEEELEDLKDAIRKAMEEFGIEGVVTGAVASNYQAQRIQRICDELGLECVNPLWMMDQEKVLMGVIENGFEAIITGIFAEPLTEEWLGRRLDKSAARDLLKLRASHSVSPTGEGGEFETTVLDAPFFRKRIEVIEAEKQMIGENSGVFVIKKARLAIARSERKI
ncbi:MAG: diphthine--ammonia ligase [Candidatus Diapherotrites archaeon]|nr:diphthine--ammonia ligase [Candidatus Diapherotrites archaeon]